MQAAEAEAGKVYWSAPKAGSAERILGHTIRGHIRDPKKAHGTSRIFRKKFDSTSHVRVELCANKSEKCELVHGMAGMFGVRAAVRTRNKPFALERF